jgi:hypothetical protein
MFAAAPAATRLIAATTGTRKACAALIDGTTPQQWYEFLNGRVFMWAEEKRLHAC